MVFLFGMLVLHSLYARLAERSASARGKSKSDRGQECALKGSKTYSGLASQESCSKRKAETLVFVCLRA